jgi:HD superfamily phosphohydrolase
MIAMASYRGLQCLALRNYVPLEQILFSKMTLYGSVYHHPKVKCVDAMLGSLIRHIAENSDQCGVQVRDKVVGFADPVEYLYTTDEEFFNQFQDFGDEFVKKMLRRFRQRDLFVRCVEMSRRTVSNWDDYHRKNLVDLSTLNLGPKHEVADGATSASRPSLHDVETEIHKSLPTEVRTRCNLGEVLLSVPGLPKMTGDFAYIQTACDTPMEPIDDFFPLPQWTLAYAHNKWRSFVYAPREYADAVRDTAIPLLKGLLGIDIDREKSNQACHLT